MDPNADAGRVLARAGREPEGAPRRRARPASVRYGAPGGTSSHAPATSACSPNAYGTAMHAELRSPPLSTHFKSGTPRTATSGRSGEPRGPGRGTGRASRLVPPRDPPLPGPLLDAGRKYVTQFVALAKRKQGHSRSHGAGVRGASIRAGRRECLYCPTRRGLDAALDAGLAAGTYAVDTPPARRAAHSRVRLRGCLLAPERSLDTPWSRMRLVRRRVHVPR